ncbi:CmcJ/NvfI family oxidoreductase [Ruegeria lacuscaerulensis]|uniref:CmcJ/NvfI family oxidoreductase n=1 Tax=Ruegeria lacuscaerulensis TaxID=55218 RepID=UPI00147A0798|nr:CmcJ/NvfI family oxidoreductase [Ruegeria lacuscaerulensis]
MTRTATVNYHVHKPYRQAFELDAGGIAGNLVSPELGTTSVTLVDNRATTNTVKFASDSVEFVALITQVQHLSGAAWKPIYDAELTAMLSDRLGAREVLVFDHTVRKDDPSATRKPARNVHSDYSKDGAEQRLADLLGAEVAAEWAQGHYAFVNVWRPIEHPINSAPLGFVRPSSVDPSDWILLDLIYPDRKGQIMGLVENPKHSWVYQSKMTPDEVAIFNIYDNQGLPSVAHSALDMVEDPRISTIRKSIESRRLVRY